MKKLIYLIKDTFMYYKKSIYIATAVYTLSIVCGIIIFQNEIVPINPTTIPFSDLLLHNGFTVILIIIAGIISFGILGNFVIIANGIILGRIIIGVYNSSGIYPIIHYIAPHFLFETFAILIGAAISYETYKLFYNIRHIEPKIIRLKFITICVIIILLLLSVAAFIESSL